MVWRNGFAFELSDEEKFACETAANFAAKEIAPRAAQIDRDHLFPQELLPKMGALGLMGSVVPVEYGGSGLSTVAYALIVEELSAACASTGIIVSAHTSLCMTPVIQYGTLQQKEEFLPALAAGEGLGCFALSEPSTGSDAASITCGYTRDGDDFIINGTKNWITNGPEATVCVFSALTTRVSSVFGRANFHDLHNHDK